jgi:hypothetical protein
LSLSVVFLPASLAWPGVLFQRSLMESLSALAEPFVFPACFASVCRCPPHAFAFVSWQVLSLYCHCFRRPLARGGKRPPPKVRREGRQQTSVQAGRRRQSKQRAVLPASRKASLAHSSQPFATPRKVDRPRASRHGQANGNDIFRRPACCELLATFSSPR